ncbi:glycosyltransferase involved in cell wall biosynthesis [Marinobacter pelagius]|uniref:Glycosyltransferase involved in cell wall biosynthesis n=1 Tax=Marinobacter pelagius TaxID=379482 RepID=A0A366GL50_9GAMM|nr:glycosyltransferase family 4 protein [Marinobacter pelagius]RBP27803.1 glycosyltransferase involved in cell wall biosynthesis [Marinobacter pelagius]
MPASDLGEVRFLVPGDPGQNTGGYRYVRQLVRALNEQGVSAGVTGLAGQFPKPDREATTALDRALAECPDNQVVVLDGLAMGGLPEVVAGHADRLKLVALVHHPLADETGLAEADREWFFNSERDALGYVRAVVTTSPFTRTRLADFGVPAARIASVEPGVDDLFIDVLARRRHRPATAQKPMLLCVAHFSPRKAQHHLVQALAELADLPWRCVIVGSTERDGEYASRIRDMIGSHSLEDRFELTGELEEGALADCYSRSDAFVFPSLYEGYGMAVDEALAAGLPVICSDGGALSRMTGREGVALYPAGDTMALRHQLQRWLVSPQTLQEERRHAESAAGGARRWRDTAADFQAALQRLLGPAPDSLFDKEWLEAREPADHRARSEALTVCLNRWLQRQTPNPVGATEAEPLVMADIGSGRASNSLYLSSRLSVPRVWHLIEQDAGLLALGEARLRQIGQAVVCHNLMLTSDEMEQQLPAPMHLLTASALIDLVSEGWLRSLTKAVVRRQAAVLMVLSYAGDFELSPPDADDARLKELVNNHQHRDKGSGSALGPDATNRFRQLLQDAGYGVHVEDSPWHLDRDDAVAVESLLRGWVWAALEQAPEASAWLGAWLERRLGQLAAGELQVTVTHQDLLALPGEGRDGQDA